MMNRTTLSFLMGCLALCFTARAEDAPMPDFPHTMPVQTNQAPLEPSIDEMKARFLDPVPYVQTAVYWYWISGNASCEGIEKDIQAMKSVGIDRAQIGDIGVDGIERGAIRTFSPQWWEAIHTALRAATQSGVEIGIFNCPGWSQSGGPWVDSTRTMRYLTGSVQEVSGPDTVTLKCPRRSDEFQDVRVIAFPKPKNARLDFEIPEGFVANKGAEAVLEITPSDSFTARSLTVQTAETPINGTGRLEAKIDGKYQTVKEFPISRYNSALDVGFIPYAPVVVSFPAVEADGFRLVISSDRDGVGLKSAYLELAPRMDFYPEKTLAKMHQTPHPLWSDYQWPLPAEIDDLQTVLDPAGLKDLTDLMDENKNLRWEVPEGQWLVFWTGMVPTGAKNAPAVPEATGYETDKMSREHIYHHFDSMMGEILRRIPEEDRKSLRVVVQDSYEVGGQNFTDGMLRDFAARYGYDPTPFLPAWFGYVVGDVKTTERFLWDLRRYIADEVAYSYVGGLRDISNEYGLTTWLECYGHWGFPGEFLLYGGQSDEVAGEFWSEGTLGDIENRIASSCGHIYGKRRIWSESDTCGGNPFGRSPIDMKIRTDRFFSEGINQSLLHLYIQQPDERLPGMNAWFGNEFNRHNTWFSQLDLFITYLKRCNYLLQQGINVADVAYFICEDTPKMTGAVDPPLPAGYQYDFINAEVLEHSAFVRDGMITLPHGTQYAVLVLPKLDTMRPELLKKIEQLIQDGATVIGPAPVRSPSNQNQPAADEQVRQIAERLWKGIDGKNVLGKTYGKGFLGVGTLDTVLDLVTDGPDCRFDASLPLVYCHRTLDHAQIYFLANQSTDPIDASVSFRCGEGVPSFWDPTTGRIKPVVGWKAAEGRTEVPVKLAPRESTFILFDAEDPTAADQAAAGEEAADEVLLSLDSGWTVTFDSGEVARGPKEPVAFDSLIDWTLSQDPAVKFYSGTASYAKSFTLPKSDKRVILSLGKVAEMAKVYVNDQYVGGVWTDPYELDVTDAVREGSNSIRIDVVNTWVNRLIGDAALPEEQRKTWAPVNNYTPESPLKSSGLLGPVEIKARR